jgi:hypothetical protein
MFVGYSPNHAADTLRMWDPDTKRVHLTRDIVWLNKMFFNNNLDFIDFPGRPNKNSRDTSTNNKAESDPENESDLDNDIQINDNNDKEDVINNNIIENTKTTRSGRVIKNLLIKKQKKIMMTTNFLKCFVSVLESGRVFYVQMSYMF